MPVLFSARNTNLDQLFRSIFITGPLPTHWTIYFLKADVTHQMPMHLIGATYVDALMLMHWCGCIDADCAWCSICGRCCRWSWSGPARGPFQLILIWVIHWSNYTIIFRPHCEKLILAKVFWLITGRDFYSPLSPPFTRELNQNTYRSHESSPRKQEVINFSLSEQVRHWYSPVKSGGSGRYIVSIFSGLVLIF